MESLSNEGDFSEKAFYDACSGSFNNIKKLLNKWETQHGQENNLELEEKLSIAFENLKIQNRSLLVETVNFVEEKLINLRFFHDKNADASLCKKPSLDDVKARIDMAISNIRELLKMERVDEIFLYRVKFLAQIIHGLKRHLKSSYDKLPWEEVEFLLVSFYGYTLKIESFLGAVTERNILMNCLQLFVGDLEVFGSEIDNNIVNSHLPKESRQDFISRNTRYAEIYIVYEQIRDIYSLRKIQKCIKMTQLTYFKDSDKDISDLVVERALQVTGEYIKNTWESPHMSTNLTKLLQTRLHKKVSGILEYIRDNLSHAFGQDLGTRTKKFYWFYIKKAKSFHFDLKDDLQKLLGIITEILGEQQLGHVELFLNKIIEYTAFDEVKQFSNFFLSVDVKNIYKEYVKSLPFMKILTSAKILKEKLGNSDTNHDDYVTVVKYVDEVLNLIHNNSTLSELTKCQIELGNLAVALSYNLNQKSVHSTANSMLKSFKNYWLANMKDQIKIALLCKNSFFETNRLKSDIRENRELAILDADIADLCFSYGQMRTIEVFGKQIEFETDDSYISDMTRIIAKGIDEKAGHNLLEEKLADVKELSVITALPLESQVFVRKLCHLLKSVGVKGKNLKIFKDSCQCQGTTDEPMCHCTFTYRKEHKQTLSTIKRNYNTETAVKGFLKDRQFEKVAVVMKSLLIGVQKSDREIYDRVIEEVKKEEGTSVQEYFKEVMNNYEKIRDVGAMPLVNETEWKEILSVAMEKVALDVLAYAEEKLEGFCTNQSEVTSFLDKYSPSLLGRQLRNHLAHGNTLVEITLYDTSVTLSSNLFRIFQEYESGTFTEEVNRKKGAEGRKVIGQNGLSIEKLKERHESALELLNLKSKMFSFAEKGSIEKLKDRLNNQKVDLLCRDLKGWGLLHYAAKGDQLEIFQYLTNEISLSIDDEDLEGRKPIHIAAFYGSEKVLKYLVEKKTVNVLDTFDNLNNTLLHHVCEGTHDKVEVVNILLGAISDNDKKEFVNAKNEELLTALLIASYGDKQNIVKTLVSILREQNDPTAYQEQLNKALRFASKNGHLKTVDVLLVNWEHWDLKTGDVWNPIFFATKTGHDDVVNHLLKYLKQTLGEDFYECISSENITLLHVAVYFNHTKIFDQLIDFMKSSERFKSFVNQAILDSKHTCLHIAAQYGYHDILKALLKVECIDINCLTTDGESPLHLAAKHGHPDIVKSLISFAKNKFKKKFSFFGKDNFSEFLNKSTAEGFTPLHLAVYSNKKSVVSIFLNEDCTKLDAVTRENGTIFYIASAKGNPDILMLLEDEKINQHYNVKQMFLAKNINGYNILGCGCLSGNRDIIQIILNYAKKYLSPEELMGFVMDSNNHGYTAIHIAAQLGEKKEVASILIDFVKTNFKNKDNVLCEFLNKPLPDDFEGLAPIHIAVYFERQSVVEILLQKSPVSSVLLNALTKKKETVFHLACQKEHEQIFELLLKSYKEAFPNDTKQLFLARDERGYSILFSAATSGNQNIIRAILSYAKEILSTEQFKEFVRAESINGMTALHVAAENGHAAAVDILVNKFKGCKYKNNYTPLHGAIKFQHAHVVAVLLKHGECIDAQAETGHTPLHYAAEVGNLKILNVLIGFAKKLFQGRNEEFSEFLNKPTGEGFTPLHLAILHDRKAVVEILLQEPLIIITSVTNLGKTIFHIASEKGHDSIFELLLKSAQEIIPDHTEALLLARDKSGSSVLFFTAYNGNQNIVNVILSYAEENSSFRGIVKNLMQDLMGKNYGGETPIHIAAQFNNKDFLVFLLQYCTDVNEQKYASGYSPLHFAAGHGYNPIVECLLKKGADKDLMDKQGNTALHIASAMKNPSVVKTLLENGADPNIKTTNSQRTALHFAVLQGNPTIVEELLKRKPNIKQKDIFGKDAMSYAVKQGHAKIYKMLLLYTEEFCEKLCLFYLLILMQSFIIYCSIVAGS